MEAPPRDTLRRLFAKASNSPSGHKAMAEAAAEALRASPTDPVLLAYKWATHGVEAIFLFMPWEQWLRTQEALSELGKLKAPEDDPATRAELHYIRSLFYQGLPPFIPLPVPQKEEMEALLSVLEAHHTTISPLLKADLLAFLEKRAVMGFRQRERLRALMANL